MYGWLYFDNTRNSLGTSFYFCNLLQAPPLTPEVLTNRRKRVATLVGQQGNALAAGRRDAVSSCLNELVGYLPDQDFEFGLHMGLAHTMLPEVQRQQREDVIERILNAEFAEVMPLQPKLSEHVKLLRITAPTLPDAMVESLLRNQCAVVRVFMSTQPEPPPAYQHLGDAFVGLKRCLAQADPVNFKDMAAFALPAYAARPPSQREAFVDLIVMAMKTGRRDAILATKRLCNSKVPKATHGWLSDTLVAVLRDVTQPDAAPVDEVVAGHVERLRLQDAIQRHQVLRESVAAVLAGVPMGDPYTERARNALEIVRQRAEESDQRMTRQRMRSAKPVAQPTPSLASNTERIDLDPVHAWSVNRLVRWIDGPLVRHAAGPNIDRKAIAVREKQAVALRAQTAKQQNKPALKPEVPLAEADVDFVIDDGLAATAQFFADDIAELLPLAEQLKAASETVEACAKLIVPLQGLANNPRAMPEAAARELLGAAETCIGDLRHGIKGMQMEVRRKNRFINQLSDALRNETMVLGKRNGGAIACPCLPTDWPWVAEHFHRCWLPAHTTLVVDGVPRPLQADEALALYVTGTSQSRYAFDVSVHLWRRKPECNSPPGLQADLYPPMNVADWFDTYITCCVLHVPGNH